MKLLRLYIGLCLSFFLLSFPIFLTIFPFPLAVNYIWVKRQEWVIFYFSYAVKKYLMKKCYRIKVVYIDLKCKYIELEKRSNRGMGGALPQPGNNQYSDTLE